MGESYYLFYEWVSHIMDSLIIIWHGWCSINRTDFLVVWKRSLKEDNINQLYCKLRYKVLAVLLYFLHLIIWSQPCHYLDNSFACRMLYDVISLNYLRCLSYLYQGYAHFRPNIQPTNPNRAFRLRRTIVRLDSKWEQLKTGACSSEIAHLSGD